MERVQKNNERIAELEERVQIISRELEKKMKKAKQAAERRCAKKAKLQPLSSRTVASSKIQDAKMLGDPF